MRQVMTGASKYVSKTRKHHEKFYLCGGPFDGSSITLSKNCFNTSIFSAKGSSGSYKAKTKFSKNFKRIILVHSRESCKNIKTYLPCLWWCENE